MQFYQNVSALVSASSSTQNAVFVQLRLAPLTVVVQQTALEWVSALGGALQESAVTAMQETITAIAEWSLGLKTAPDDIDALKSVLRIQHLIKQQSLEMELAIVDINERYRTLNIYTNTIVDKDTAELRKLEQAWVDLNAEASELDESLVTVKRSFRKSTKKQAAGFLQETVELAAVFQTTGPGHVGADMDTGLEKFNEYAYP